MTARMAGLLAMSLIAAAACNKGTEPPPSATVHFEIDAPLCSSVIPVELYIDDVLVGQDTFIVNYGPSHMKTRGFRTPAGTHKLGARMPPPGYVWSDTTVTLEAGQVFTDSLPFYCS